MFFKYLSLTQLGFIIGLLCSPIANAAPEPSHRCAAANTISKTFPSGATWQLCAEMRPEEGLTLSQVYYAAPKKPARRVLGEASLSQLETVFDTETVPRYLVTQHGLGRNLQPLTATDCPNGSIKTMLQTKALCRNTQEYGYQYKYQTQRQGSFFELITHYNLAPQIYSVRWRFYENGIIEPAIGVSGQLSKAASNRLENFTLHAGWRLDFDLGATGSNDQILEVTSTPTEDRLRKRVSIATMGREHARLEDPELKRLWMIRDGTTPYEGISVPAYDLVPNQYTDSRLNPFSEPWLKWDIYFSKYNPCERYAADNRLNDCPAKNTHAVRYISNKESIDGADSVVWYKQTYHHIVRSDDALRLGTVWSSFQLVPRDWHSQNQF
ncbi:Copper amine oxidase, enzyme domain [Thiothrix eikelboomii]|uniref:Amine oxidase n=1 Tax=Thiothrix eikelboomii TaxID=92487 RepID=A0A1T4X2X2_9GAMM|nr:hypothetical protein [Thiothrix eikelboomii]SKA83950.1 Copper amine oxidase, enzyme domain [Thiothrix eikelboomii]